MPRNSAGVYSLPGSAFVSGTVIDSAAMNAKFTDLTSAMTDSLSRTGSGDMLAPLRVPDGSAALPSLAWSSDVGTGFYLSAASTFRAVILASTAQEWSSTAVSINKPLTVTQAGTFASTLTATGTFTANGTSAFNGATSVNQKLTVNHSTAGSGTSMEVRGTSTGNGVGRVGVARPLMLRAGTDGGAGIGFNCYFNGTNDTRLETGFSGDIFQDAGGTIRFRCADSGAAGTVALTDRFALTAGAAVASAATPVISAAIRNGYLTLDGVTNPNDNVAFTNTLTPRNIPKAIASVATNGAGAVTVTSGFNVTSATIAASGAGFGNIIRIAFASGFTSAAYEPSITVDYPTPNSSRFQSGSRTTSEMEVVMTDASGAYRNPATSASGFILVVYGPQ